MGQVLTCNTAPNYITGIVTAQNAKLNVPLVAGFWPTSEALLSRSLTIGTSLTMWLAGFWSLIAALASLLRAITQAGLV